MSFVGRFRMRAVQALLPAAIAIVAGCGSENTAPAPRTEKPAVTQTAPQQIAKGAIAFVDDYKAASEIAQREGRPMLIFFTAKWCQYCHELANEVFTQEQVVNVSKNFVCVAIDADAAPETCREFKVRAYPTVQFISPRGVPLNRIVGKKPAHQFIMEMQAALQAVAHREQISGDTIRR